MRNSYAEINLGNLIKNYQNIAAKVGKKTKVMPVVKADAYGHGMIECAKALLDSSPKPDYFAVAIPEEAIQFRKKLDSKILVFGRIEPKLFTKIIKWKITPTFWFEDDIRLYDQAAASLNVKAPFHLEIDTGMRRTGIDPGKINDFIKCIHECKNLIFEGCYTHFATSDSKNKSFANHQLTIFNKVIETLKKKKIKPEIIHCANSGAILDLPDTYFNYVRPGISLYGYYPSNETSESIKLHPVMTIKSHPSAIRRLSKNLSVSYGQTYRTKSETQIITIPFGYADGYNRLLSNKGRVIINDRFFKVVGRVCMDYIMIDVGDEKVSLKSEVVLMGKSMSCNFDAKDISSLIDTIPYEICTSVSKRVKRKYIK